MLQASTSENVITKTEVLFHEDCDENYSFVMDTRWNPELAMSEPATLYMQCVVYYRDAEDEVKSYTGCVISDVTDYTQQQPFGQNKWVI